MMGYLYYYISFLSGVVELGCIFWGLNREFSMLQVIGLVMSYQMGNVLQYFIPKKAEHYSQYFLGLSLIACVASEYLSFLEIVSYMLALLALIIGSTFLQLEREAVKIKVEEWEKWKKRAWRVVGFFVAFSLYLPYGTWILCAILLSLIIIGFYSKDFGYDEWFVNFIDNKKNAPKLCWTMITHQAHYFVYTYVLCILVFEKYHSALIASIWFVLNWIPYTITEPLVKFLKIEKYYLKIGIAAHLFNGIVLIGVYVFLKNNNILGAVLLWMLTGFGGGNIYCVRKGMEPYIEYDNDTWMFSEQVGHILGMIVSIVLVALGKSELTMIVAAFFALVTVPIIIKTIIYHSTR